MANEILKRDQNSAVVLGGITDDSNQFIKMLRVDPTTGRLLVTATGGTGFTELAATGTVDGTNLAFTFTQQPSYIVVDGYWMKALDNNGGTQWSWNAGTSTVTLIIPPTNAIFGIA